MTPRNTGQIRFGLFELDIAAGELRKRGRVLKLQEQPFQVLTALVLHPGEIVGREELQRAVWPSDTFVAFDEGLNTAIRKIRQVLGDSAENPRFIETLPRRGYRFIAPVMLPPVAPAAVDVSVQTRNDPSRKAGSKPASLKRWWFWAIPVIAVTAAISLWQMRQRDAHAVFVPVPLTTFKGDEVSPDFSPDGNQVVFAWNPSEDLSPENFDIYIKQIGGADAMRVNHGPASGFSPAWSPDGRWIVFLRSLTPVSDGVFLVPAIGGGERKLGEIYADDPLHPYYGRGLSWSSDSRSIVVVDQNHPSQPAALFRLSVETGEKLQLTFPPPGVPGDYTPAVSPDGKSVAFTRCLTGNACDLFLLPLSNSVTPAGEPKRLTFEKTTADPAWTSDGRTIILVSGPVHNAGLWKLDISQPGKLERLAFAAEGVSQPAISRQGRLAYQHQTEDVDIWRIELNGRYAALQPATRIIASTRLDDEPRYSPDGRRIAFASDRSGSLEVWVCNSDGSNSVQLTSLGTPYHTAHPRWSPDGRFVAFTSNIGGKADIYVIGSEGGRPRPLRVEGFLEWSLSEWSRDGKWIYFGSNRTGKDQLWKLPWPVSGSTAAPIQVTRQGFTREATESPDGKFIFYLKGDGVVNESLWRLPAAGGAETQVIPSVFSNNYGVVPDGIYFIPAVKPYAIHFLSFPGGRESVVAKLPRTPAWGFSVSPDGRRLLYSEWRALNSDLMLVENFH